MHPQCSTLKKNDAVLLALGVWGRLSGCVHASLNGLEVVSKELSHAFFVTTFLEVHISHKTLRFCVSVRAFKEHSEVMQATNIVFANINDEARVSLLLNRDFASFLFRANLDTWLGNFNLFLI